MSEKKHPPIMRRSARPSEKEGIVSDMRWCARHKQEVNGYPFDSILTNSQGASYYFYVPATLSKDDCREVLAEAKGKYDLVGYIFVDCPDDWFPRGIAERIGLAAPSGNTNNTAQRSIEP